MLSRPSLEHGTVIFDWLAWSYPNSLYRGVIPQEPRPQDSALHHVQEIWFIELACVRCVMGPRDYAPDRFLASLIRVNDNHPLNEGTNNSKFHLPRYLLDRIASAITLKIWQTWELTGPDHTLIACFERYALLFDQSDTPRAPYWQIPVAAMRELRKHSMCTRTPMRTGW